MKQLLVFLIPLAFTPVIAEGADQKLFHLSVHDLPVENGKVLDMEFHEIERKSDSSTVQVERKSGGSVSSSMFIVRGMCGLARARGAHYVAANRIADVNDETYTVTFPQVPPELGKGFTMEQCELLRY
jgi:hypothetical protein